MQFAPLFLAGMQATATIFGGIGKGAQLANDRRIAQANEVYAAQDAVQELRSAALDEGRVRREARETIAEQFAAMATSGLGATSFSASKSLEESATNAEMDALKIRYRGELGARNDTIRSQNFKFQAAADKQAEKFNIIDTVLGAGTQLLGGAAKQQGVKI